MSSNDRCSTPGQAALIAATSAGLRAPPPERTTSSGANSGGMSRAEAPMMRAVMAVAVATMSSWLAPSSRHLLTSETEKGAPNVARPEIADDRDAAPLGDDRGTA